jgi:gliding motility-associated peptidyl-prolyl isomerase
MKTSFLLLLSIVFLISCAHPKPRKPITHTGRVDMSESIAFNKRLFQLEKEAFERIMQQDSIHTYINSKYGFWYAYEVENTQDTIKPVTGDRVVFSYDVTGIDGQVIYTKEELGNKTYLVDQQDFMQGIQEGIKFMNVNEKVIFLLPSQKAYAYYGDENKIGTNTPLIVNVELLEIKSN